MATWTCIRCGKPLDSMGFCGMLPLTGYDDTGAMVTPVCRACFNAHYTAYPIATYCDGCGRNLQRRYDAAWRCVVLVCPLCGDKQRIKDRDIAYMPEAKQQVIERIQSATVAV